MLTIKQKNALIVNFGLLIVGVAMVISGMVILLKYHMGHHGEIIATNIFFGLDYNVWSRLHKIMIVVFSLLVLFHIVLHWEWYKNIIRKNLLGKNKQVITLSILFILVAITGFSPWLVQLCGGSEITRKVFLEIHDKLGVILCIYLILHVIKRFKWFVNMCRKIVIDKFKI